MELVKKNIHMNKLKCKSTLQLTLDDDFNVPDVKPDIANIITEQGEITIKDIKAMDGKLLVKGALGFNILYLSDDNQNPIHNISGDIPFDEIINMETSCADDEPTVNWELEDLSTGLINSRKISVKSIVSLNITIDELYDEETAVMVEGSDDVQFINKKIEVTDVSINKKDTFRIKDELILPSNKGNISSILYKDIQLNNVEVRLLEDRFSIKGELPIFVLYTTESEESPMEYYETEVPFGGIIECSGSNEDMIDDITFKVLSNNLEIKEDGDGEGRVLDFEVILEMDIMAYDIQEPEILCDIYSPSKEITPVTRRAEYENLVVKNNSKYRVVDRIKVSENEPKILQICHANASIKIDDIIPTETELNVEGAIDIKLLYITENDNRPMNAIKGSIPFTQSIEVKNIKADSSYDIKPSVEQLAVMMLDSDEIEVKATMNLNTIVFDKVVEEIITDIEVEDIDLDKLQAMPGVVGYMVKPKDTLWNIAKKYHTTVDAIKNINNLEEDIIKEGEKLIILKKVETII